MKKRLYLHIGFPKTGTTSIQHFCSLYRGDLLEEGILYPRSGRDHFRYFYSSHNRDIEMGISNLINEIEDCDTCAVTLLSDEELIKLPLDDVALCKKRFESFDGRVLIYHREFTSWVLSMYKHHIKLGCTYHSLKGFIKKNEDLFDQEKRINNWISVFGTDRVELRKFESVNTNIVYDFLKYIGVKNESLLRRAECFEKKNRSLGDGTLIFILFINRIKFSLPYFLGFNGLELSKIFNDPNKKNGLKENVIRTWSCFFDGIRKKILKKKYIQNILDKTLGIFILALD